MRCKHVSSFVSCVQTSTHFRSAEVCTCGEWFSLGPATITPDVEIEIRAAELAMRWDGEDVNSKWSDGLLEWGGYRANHRGDGCPQERSPEWQAGYLAAAILDENEQGAE